MKQIEVQIMGQSYLLGCPVGGESQLMEAVQRVDSAMCKIRDGGKVRSRDRIAVLAALNLAFDLGLRASAAGDASAAASTQDDQADPRDDEQVLSSLLTRLDRALGADGQLI
ncbi:MAG: cell division protein ZapA [Burkholderiaceae bacterium]|jgi:cell division protein ZapA